LSCREVEHIHQYEVFRLALFVAIGFL